MIYQELALAPDLSVEANVMLGQERVRDGLSVAGEHRKLVADALDVARTSRHPARGARSATWASAPSNWSRWPAPSSRVPESSSSTNRPARYPNTTPSGYSRLSSDCARRGLAIIYISHFLEETRRVAQTYTVLRDGKSVAAGRLGETDLKSIIAQMVGRDLDELFPHVPHTPGEPVLELDQLRVRKVGETREPGAQARRDPGYRRLDRRRPDHARALDLRAWRRSSRGASRSSNSSGGYAPPRTRIGQGVGFASEDRKTEGLALARSIEDNMTYSALKRHARRGWLKLNDRRTEVAHWIARLRISATGPGQVTANLSGGNQQKVALARLLHQRADVLLLDEPTRGIDVGSKAEIYRLIGELAAAGKAILVVSSYLPELFGICDRIAVMSRGSTQRSTPRRPVDGTRSDGCRDPHRLGLIDTRHRGAIIPRLPGGRLHVAASPDGNRQGIGGRSSCAAAWAGPGRSSARSSGCS